MTGISSFALEFRVISKKSGCHSKGQILIQHHELAAANDTNEELAAR